MPPKRTSSKRKIEQTDASSDAETPPETQLTESQSQSQSQSSTSRTKKKTKVAKKESSTGQVENDQPKNLTIPDEVSFETRKDGTIRIAAWNVCGITTAAKKNSKVYIQAESADILILTETKCNEKIKVDALGDLYEHEYWSCAKTKYAGTAIFSKIPAVSVSYDLPGHPDPDYVKGRIVTAEFDSFYVVGTYVPNSGVGLKTLDVRKVWDAHFRKYLHELDSKKPVIWAGDLNVCPTEKDLARPKQNWNKTPGYTEAECSAFARILTPEDGEGEPFVDVWRQTHPDTRHYTYFSFRFQCRQKGLGWRLDHFVVSKRLCDKVAMCEIRDEIWGASDHCPIVLDIVEAS